MKAVPCGALMVLLLAGCAQAPVQLYHWDGYQRNVYTQLKRDEAYPAEQLQNMTVQANVARNSGKKLPPGYHGHMAMLMVQLGQYDGARQELEMEKAEFPESGPYMDFLLKQLQEKKS